jgi:hypothetical protein
MGKSIRYFAYVVLNNNRDSQQKQVLQFTCLRIVPSRGWEHSPHRLVVRTSRCARDNPGLTPGEDISTMSVLL